MDKLNTSDKMVLEIISKFRKPFKNIELSKKLKVDRQQIHHKLTRLVNMGLLEKEIINRKNVVYKKVVNDGN